jgi:hypothetical protein
MEDSSLLAQTLLIVIAIPCLVLFYWFIGVRFLTLTIKIVKTIWHSTD